MTAIVPIPFFVWTKPVGGVRFLQIAHSMPRSDVLAFARGVEPLGFVVEEVAP